VSELASEPMSMARRRTIVVAGNGMVGHKVVETLLARGATRDWDIVVFGEERRLAYDRVGLSSFFAGTTAEELSLVAPGAYDGVDVRLGDPVVGIDRDASKVVAASGAVVAYDALVLATGSYPFVPAVPGHDLPGCFVYRTLDDLEAIRAYAAGRRAGAVVGGGLLGLEAANALHHLGLETHVVEFAPRLMPVQVDDGGAAALQARIAALGVAVHTSMATTELVAGADGAVAGMRFAEGCELDELAVDLVVFSAGIRPRDEIARRAGLEIGERGGVVVDSTCRTSDPRVYAVGECALAAGRVWGLVAPGYEMARVAVDRILGGDGTFECGDLSTKLKLMGVDVASFGDAFGAAPDADHITFHDAVNHVYKRLVVARGGRRVLGGVLVGDTSAYQLLLQMARDDMPVPDHVEHLVFPEPAGGAPLGIGIGALAETASVCSCNNVSKGAICAAIAEGALTDVGGIKAATKAGTTCGGCVPLVTDLLEDELRKAGLEVRNHLCEHFAYSRQELFEIVRVHRIVSFSELLAAHGTGLGCEICKPAVASMLASITNGYILDDDQAGLQDTNDHFLANLQRDGTYSVVPRVPGGEITPDQLIAIGGVAKEFGLYTKITGGQRIDLFGAHVDQLPAIWARLIDAGMESGHAYGKALRTVKSCVGQTWCRYGVQDSTSMAIRLELRYRGLRAPHKIKSAVSGCARECAEAQSKDFGIIATERGWNLYVGGNGGMRPQHGVLLAEDLDDDSLVRIVDRFLMYYIRTADRLERTATWLNNLDGGVDQLRRVVIDDALGIAAELEADMERHIASYECEWKATIADPARMRRFRTFVNADGADPNIVMVPERGQPRPANPAERPTPMEAVL
jgi:nitrite reductase (NADH) large subunit